MRITSLETIVVAIPFSHGGPPTGFGGQQWTHLNHLLVRIDTDQGLSGWGEAFGYNTIPATRAVLERQIAPLVIGRDARDIRGLNADLQKTMHLFGRGGPAMFAISGVDIALWDLAGKAAGLPLCQLLGGSPALALPPAYASFMRYTDPGHVARACERALACGYAGFKLHEITEPAVAAARSAIGDRALMVDVNCEWNAADAERMARAFAPHGLAWLEEPVWPPEDIDALRLLRERTGVALAAGENAPNGWGLRQLGGVVDFLQPSVTKLGGVTEFAALAQAAELSGRQLAPHSPYFGPGLLATLHLAAAFRSVTWIERLFVDFDMPLYPGLASVDAQSRLTLPAGPGLGADPDPQAIARWRID